MHKTLFANFVCKDSKGNQSVAETLKLKSPEGQKVIDLLQVLYTHLETRNDGNKIYKFEKVARSMQGFPINAGHYVDSHFDDQEEVFVFVDAQIDNSKTVKPIFVKPIAPAKESKV